MVLPLLLDVDVNQLERKSYWGNFAMVRADYQNKGVGTALFQLAFRKVRDCHEYPPRFQLLIYER